MCNVNYNPDEHIALIEKLTRDGCTDDEIAKHIGIHRSTFYRWRQRYPELQKAAESGKRLFDEKVEEALHKRALGYDLDVERIEEGENDKGPFKKTIRYKNHIPGDVTAQIFWLKNRQPDKWRDKQEHKIEGHLDLSNIGDTLAKILSGDNDSVAKNETNGID